LLAHLLGEGFQVLPVVRWGGELGESFLVGVGHGGQSGGDD